MRQTNKWTSGATPLTPNQVLKVCKRAWSLRYEARRDNAPYAIVEIEFSGDDARIVKKYLDEHKREERQQYTEGRERHKHLLKTDPDYAARWRALRRKLKARRDAMDKAQTEASKAGIP